MSGLIMIGLIALMVGTIIVMLIMRQGRKRILVAFVGFLVVIGIFNFYVVKTCGPNAKDVEIMTPQAEAISDYILKNGIPESMADIQNLPYKLESCKKATDGTNVEWCYFNVDGDKHSTRLYFLSDNYGANIYIKTYNKKSETGVFTEIKKTSDGVFEVVDYFKPYSTKNDGICNPLRM